MEGFVGSCSSDGSYMKHRAHFVFYGMTGQTRAGHRIWVPCLSLEEHGESGYLVA